MEKILRFIDIIAYTVLIYRILMIIINITFFIQKNKIGTFNAQKDKMFISFESMIFSILSIVWLII